MAQSEGGMSQVLPAHRFDPAPLARYLRTRLADFGPCMRLSQIQGGVSNPTFLIETGEQDEGARYVLRKKPPGPLLQSAHRIDREHRVMTALAASGVPAPRTRLYCADPGVIGAEFYIMDFLDGRIFRDARLPGMQPTERAAIYDEMNAVLAQLHLVDPAQAGLADYGASGNYFERQIGRWIKQYRAAETEVIPAMEELIRRLPLAIPKEGQVRIAHGDYRLENLMYHPSEPKIVGVLDWELSTLGDPVADLAYNCFLWHCHDPAWGTLDGVDLAESGIPTEAEYVAAYCRRTARAGIDDWSWGLAFAIFRLASIAQGVYARVRLGNASTDRRIENGAGALADQALASLNGVL